MGKLTSGVLKILVLSVLLVQVVFAADVDSSSSSFAEPLYLSLCGLVLLTFGMLKGRKENDS
ncbi:MAG: hypothetical protein ACI93R_002656 [Flavobacteriales bacterium]|jgi:hypothetical protein